MVVVGLTLMSTDDGGGEEVTVTVKLQLAVFWGCELSVAVTCTVVVIPTGKLLPDSGEPLVV